MHRIFRQARLFGTVVAEMIITEAGKPVEIEIVESAGPLLDQAVLDAIKTWRYRPAMRDGRPVRIRWRVRQQFSIRK